MPPTLQERGIDTTIPFTVDADGVMTKDAPGFEGKRVLKENGDKGDANDAVIKALAEAGEHHRARPPEASVPALLALQEAGHLPQHAAVVHRDGQAACATGGRLRRRRVAGRNSSTLRAARARRDRATPSGCPPPAENRITGMIAAGPIG